MRTERGKGLALVGLVCLVPLASGCVSKKALEEYQDEVTQLREERTRLKKENRDLEAQLDQYTIALAEANSKLESQPEAPSYPDLDAFGIDYGQRGGNPYISIPAEITFASGKADLTANGKKALKAVAGRLGSEYPGAVFWIEGHTDSDPIRKSKWASNRELSMYRALAVLHFLVEECGLPDDRCVVAGHGQYQPIASNESPKEKARNRRVEIVVHAPRI